MRTSDATTATKEDSGLIDLKALSQSDVTANARASAPPSVPAPLASAGLFDEDAPASRAAAPVSQAPISQAPVSHAPRASAPSVVPAAVHSAPSMPVPARDQVASKADSDSERKGGALFLFGGVATIAAIAAGVFFVVRSSHPTEPAPIAVVQQSPAIAAPAAAPAEAPKAVAQAEKTSGAVDPMSLPEATAGKSPAAAKGGAIAKATPASAAKAASAAAGKPEAKEPETKAAVEEKLVAKDLPQSPATTGSLGDAMKQAAGPSTDSPSAAATNPGAVIQPGSVSQKPSQGAVTGALGAALPSARACLGPDDPVSRAEIVFESGGSVKSVNVTGAAAGKPAEACIKAALGKAKVPPFAEATYSARVTVRPN